MNLAQFKQQIKSGQFTFAGETFDFEFNEENTPELLNNEVVLFDCTFIAVYFESSIFYKQIDFKSSVFGQGVDFQGATFNEPLDFSGVTFKKDALFQGATLNEKINLNKAVFEATVDFTDCTFDEINLEGCCFNKVAIFTGASF